MNTKDGGPAFPDYDCVDEKMNTGMSLRDYFAAKAMAEGCELENEYPTGPRGESTYAGAARRAYLMADAMLAEREHTP